MPKLQLEKSKCSVVGCMNPHKSLHRPPASEPVRSAWLNFIFLRNIPTPVGKALYVCAKHFKDECFSNLQQYQEGFSERLRLIEGAVPSVYGYDELSKLRLAPLRQEPSFTNKGCQTKPKLCSVGTQLSLTTLQPHLRNKANRRLLDIEEETTPVSRACMQCNRLGGDALENSSTVVMQSLQDSTMNALTEAPGHIVKQQSSEVLRSQSVQQHQNQLDSIFLLLEDKMVTFVKKELKKIQKLLSSDHSQSLESQMTDEEDLDGEEDEKWSKREAFLKITDYFLRKMRQEELAERLQSMVPEGVKEMVAIKEEAPEEQKPDVDQQDQEHLHIKEEEMWTFMKEEQLNVKEEPDDTSFTFTAVPLKHEDDEDKPGFLQLHQHQAEVRDLPTSNSADNLESTTGGESCGGETTGNPDMRTHEDDSDSSETEVSEDDEGDNVVNNHDSQLKHLADSESEAEDTDKDWESSACRVPESDVTNNTDEQKLFLCELCGRSFNTKGKLKKHMRIHTGEKPFCCKLCERRFSLKDYLNKHMKYHTGEKPFCCELCDRRFTRKAGLNIHMKIHTGEKPFYCKPCDRGFSQKEYLKKHMRYHTGEKPFCCELCGRRFTESGHLSKHRKIHMKIKAVVSKDS